MRQRFTAPSSFPSWILVATVILLIAGQTSFGQAVGIQPFGSYVDGGLDQISLSNLGIHVDIPLFQYKGRGRETGLGAHLVYDSTYSVGTTPLTDLGWRFVPSTAAPGTILVHLDYSEFVPLPCEPGVTNCNAGYTSFVYSFAFTDSSGFSHPFQNGNGATSKRCQGQKSPSGCTNVNLRVGGQSYDGSGYYIAVNPVTPSPTPDAVDVWTPSGMLFSEPATAVVSLTDTNGNTGVSAPSAPAYWVNWSQTITDDANVSATITGGAYSSSNSTQWTSRAPLNVQYTDTLGQPQTVIVNYSLHTVNYTCQSSTVQVGLPDSIVYPDDSSYQFTYQSDGQLTSVKLPTGGMISYNPGSLCPSGIGPALSISRTTSDGTTTYNSSYASCNTTPGCPAPSSMTTVSHPDGSSEKIYFVYDLVYQGTAIGESNLSYETAHYWYSSSGSLLKSTMKCYNSATGDCTTNSVTIPITQIATTTTVGTMSSETVETMNTTGLVTELDEYDFGASSPTRKTVTSYASLGNQIADRPASVTVTNSAGTTMSTTTYGYDEYSLTSSPTGISGHAAISGSRGNRTSQHVWLNTTGTTLDSHWQYDDAGQVVAAQDPRGAQATQPYWTTYGYDSATDSCMTSTSPPVPSSGVSQTTSSTCDPNTGLLSSHTDANRVTTSYAYDSMLRLNGTTAKTSAGAVVANMTRTYSGSSLPETITTTVSASPSPSQVSTTVLDGLGRTLKTTSPNNAEVDTTYNSMGYVQSESNPYISPGDATYGITSYLYDGLGRKTMQCNPDNRYGTTCKKGASYQQTSYSGNVASSTDEVGISHTVTSDGLGRLSQVIELGTASNPLSLQTNYRYDALNNLVSVSQTGNPALGELPRSRSFTYDSLSRLLCAANPENSSAACPATATSSYTAGTIGYSYDANGNLASKTDARGVITSYSYDSLNRLQTKTYNDGTSTAAFGYDGKDSNGATLPTNYGASSNVIGRLTYASNSVNADEGFGYDAMGRVATETYCLPVNCGNRQTVSASYDLAGNESSITYPDGRVVQNGRDAAGHVNAVSYVNWNGSTTSLPQTYFSETGGYDAAGHLIAATVGTNLPYITATYDNRERMSTLTYGSSTAPVWSKQLAWTPNSNLQSQTDLITGVQRQFAYDNLNRLTAAQDIYSNLAVASGSNDQTTSTGNSGSGAEETPGGTGAEPEWTDPNNSNLLTDVGESTSSWIFSNVTYVNNSAQAPDGTMTATTLTSTAANAYLDGYVTSPSSYALETMTGSVWIRTAGQATSISIAILGTGPSGVQVEGGASKTVPVTSVWQQVAVTGGTQDSLTSLQLQIGAIPSGQHIQIWHPMLEDEGAAGSSVTNFLPNSQLPAASSWVGAYYSVTASAATAPDGSQTTSTVTAAAGSTGSYIRDGVANPAPFDQQPVTGSVYLEVQSGTLPIVVSIIENSGGSSSVCVQSTAVTLNTNWQRVSVSCTAQNTLSTLYLQVGGGSFVNGASFQLWGAQMELASSAGPYVPTAAIPVTAGTTLTNLLAYSQEMTGSSWGSTTVAMSPDTVAAPDGSMTATKVTAQSADSFVWDSAPNSALYGGATVTGSVYLKSESGPQTVNLYVYSVTSAGKQYLSTVQASLSSTWQRFHVTGTLPSSITGLVLQVGGSGSFPTGKVYDIWGAQIEIASHAGPYIATTALPIITGSEPTNILPNSQMLNGTNWSIANGSITSMTTPAPDGSNTASIFTNSATSGGYVAASVPNPSLYDGETVTPSVYLRSSASSGTETVNMYLIDVGDNGWQIEKTQSVTLNQTWQRYRFTSTVQNGLSQLYLQVGNTLTSGQGFEIWGAQLVTGSDPDSYTPTPTTTTVYASGQPGTLVPTGLNQSYSYDSFGNILQNGSFNSSYTANNQMFGYAYDASGNLISDGMNTMTWDAESRIVTDAGATYIYDAEGNRVEKQGSTVTDTVYFGGQPMARYSGGQWTDLIYGPTGLLAEVQGTQTGAPVYRVTDNLGTNIGSLLANGTFVDSVDHTPFGQVFTGNSVDPYLFTGKERDEESGLDYFGARYMASSMGRFMSPDYSDSGFDPVPVPSADYENPQSLNLYSYVHNSPLTQTDPDGHDVNVCDNNGSCHQMSNEDYQKAQQGNNGSLNVPTLDKVGSNGNGSGQFNSTAITDSSGNTVGTATYVSNGNLDYYANANGYQQLSAASTVVKGATVAVGVTFGAVAAGIAAPEIAAAIGRSGIRFALQHGLRWEAGHTMVMATASEVKVAIGAAITSGAINMGANGIFNGSTMVNGTTISFTGRVLQTGEVVVSNVFGGFPK